MRRKDVNPGKGQESSYKSDEKIAIHGVSELILLPIGLVGHLHSYSLADISRPKQEML